jgi:hypothetical protein
MHFRRAFDLGIRKRIGGRARPIGRLPAMKKRRAWPAVNPRSCALFGDSAELGVEAKDVVQPADGRLAAEG